MDWGYTTSRVGSYWVHEERVVKTVPIIPVETGTLAQLKEDTSGPPVETKLGLPTLPKKTSTTSHDNGDNKGYLMMIDVEPTKISWDFSADIPL